MAYSHDQLFDDPWKMIDFFLTDRWFRTDNKYYANSPEKGGMISCGQSDSEWKLQTVSLNPERDCIAKSHSVGYTIQPLVA